MKSKQSAGILLYRLGKRGAEVFLVHPGGPYWKNKDQGSWTIPKGELEGEEEPLAAALREFEEETGYLPAGPFIPLKPVRQKSGKVVLAWAVAGDLQPEQIRSNRVMIEWPPRSGRMMEIPEIDRGEWMGLEKAREKINMAQAGFLEELRGMLEKG